MKTVFSICLAVVILSACGQKSDKKESVNTPAATTSSTTPLINPAHGMPGHDCTLQVGAPLPQKESAQPQPANNAPVSAAPSSPVEVSKPGKLNPAHGEPGHRCDIAVGAPLS